MVFTAVVCFRLSLDYTTHEQAMRGTEATYTKRPQNICMEPRNRAGYKHETIANLHTGD